MSQVNIEEMDLENMSVEELGSVLDEMEGNPKVSKEPETKEAPQQDQDSSIQTPQEDSASQEEVVETEEPTGKTEVQEQEEDVEPHYKGKTREDLLEMQRNANRKISQQNNELYQLRKKVDELAESQKQKTEKLEQKPEDDILARYEQEDVKAIDSMIHRAFQKREADKLEKQKASIESAKAENDKVWENLEMFNPSLFAKIREEAVTTMKADLENTYHKQGWLKNFILEKRDSVNSQSTAKKTPVAKKKATTVSTSGASRNSGGSTKRVDQMSASEYEAHMNAQGIHF